MYASPVRPDPQRPTQALLGPLPQSSVGGAAIPRVCRVLVVDDGSSPKDRGVMLSSFPRFTFVFKGPEDTKGDTELPKKGG